MVFHGLGSTVPFRINKNPDMSCFSISPWHQVETNVELWTSKADEERWYPTACCSRLPMAINGAHLPIGKWWIKWWWMVGTWCSCEDIIDVLPVVGSSSTFLHSLKLLSSWVSADCPGGWWDRRGHRWHRWRKPRQNGLTLCREGQTTEMTGGSNAEVESWGFWSLDCNVSWHLYTKIYR